MLGFLSSQPRRDDEDDLFEMANLAPDTTGLPFVVWISTGNGIPHAARVKVSRSPTANGEWASITVAEPIAPMPKEQRVKLTGAEMKLLRAWVRLNRTVLLDHWTGKIPYTQDAIAALQKV